MNRFVPTCALASAFALAACAGGGAGPGGSGGASTAPPLIVATYTFPAGDATTGPGGVAWDIVGVKTTLSGTAGRPAGNTYDTLRVDVTFVQDVSAALPDPGTALRFGDQLGVSIALDVDGNAKTGIYGTCDPSNPLRPFEYFSEAGDQPNRFVDGNYGIIDPNGNLVSSGASNPAGEAVTSASGRVVTQTFYLPAVAVFGGATVPNIGIAVAAHNGEGTLPTDCVPRAPTVEVSTT